MKRILSFLLIFATILVLAVPAFALEPLYDDDVCHLSGTWQFNLDLDLTPFREYWVEDIAFDYLGVTYYSMELTYASAQSYWVKFLHGDDNKTAIVYHSQYDGYKPNYEDVNAYRIVYFYGQTVSLKFYNWVLANAVCLGNYENSTGDNKYCLDGIFESGSVFWKSPGPYGFISSDSEYFDINLTFKDSKGRMYYGMRIYEDRLYFFRYTADGERLDLVWDELNLFTLGLIEFTYPQYVPEAFYRWFNDVFTIADSSGAGAGSGDSGSSDSSGDFWDDLEDAESVQDFFEVLINGVKSMFTAILDLPKNIYKELSILFSSLKNAVLSLPDKIGEAIKGIFVPDLDRMQNKFTDFMSGLNPNTYGDNGLVGDVGGFGTIKNDIDNLGGIIDVEAEEPMNISGSLTIGDLHWDEVTWLDLDWFKEGIRSFRWVIDLWIYWLLSIFIINQVLTFIGQSGTIGSSVNKTIQVTGKGLEDASIQAHNDAVSRRIGFK